MNSELCEKLSVFCAALFGIATCSTLGTGAIALGGGAAALSLPAVMRSLRGSQSQDTKKIIAKVRKDIESNWKEWVSAGGEWSDVELEQASKALDAALDTLTPDPERLMKIGRCNTAMAALIVDNAKVLLPQLFADQTEDGRKNLDAAQAKTNARFMGIAVEKSLARLDGDPTYEAVLAPWFQREILGTTKRIEATGDDTNERVRHLENMVETLLARSEKEGDTARAVEAGVEVPAIIILARRISADIDDPERAFAELERAVDIAIDVQAEGKRGTNAGDFTDEVLKRMAALSAVGKYDDAAAEADKAFERWEREEQDRQETALQSGLKLLEAGLKQDMLRRDLVSAARRVVRQAELSMSAEADRFEVLLLVQDEWHVRGRDMGLKLELEVSCEIACTLLTLASDERQRALALNVLANTFCILGERAGGKAGAVYLRQAVDAYDTALEKVPCETTSAQWAITQMNRANALAVLGNWAGGEAGADYLRKAVDAYDVALGVTSRATMPVQWAKMQMNRANTFLALGRRAGGEAGAVYLRRAFDAYDSVLDIFTRDTMPAQWAMTQIGRANALASFGERSIGEMAVDHLTQSVNYYDAALEVTPRATMPAQWAATQINRATALRILAERKGGDTGNSFLKQAIDAYDAALEIYDRKTMPAQWAATQISRAVALRILAERKGGDTGNSFLKQAIDAYDAALEIYDRKTMPEQWAGTQMNRAVALRYLGERVGGETGLVYFRQAIETYDAALEVTPQDTMPSQWAMAQMNRAVALRNLGERTVGKLGVDYLRQAVNSCDAALEVYSEPGMEHYKKMVLTNRSMALSALRARNS